ncbi:MAG: SAM-dependent methyltransferase [Actinomadura sp.]
MNEVEQVPPGIDPSAAHPARRYNYWLGGKDNFQADRDSGDAIISVLPTVRTAALENRLFLRRTVGHLVREAGIRQFLDIGTGIPTANNTHEVAQHIAPESRIVYVDNDPIVLVHARALLNSTPEGATAYIEADLRDSAAILRHPELLATLDLSEPVALMLIATLHFLVDADDAYGNVARLVDALAPGSYLVITHATHDHMPRDQYERLSAANAASKVPAQLRSREEVGRFFTGLELLPPGIDSTTEWWPEADRSQRPPIEDVVTWAGVARIS